MTSRDFCYWLQGYFELNGTTEAIDIVKVDMIKNHLNLVFKHEIDPQIEAESSLTATEMQDIHDGVDSKPSGGHDRPPAAYDEDYQGLMRC